MQTDRTKRFRQSIRQLERQVDFQLKEGTTCCGITLAQCHTLLELYDHGRSTISCLAQTFNLDASTLSRTIDGLVKSGMVKRIIDDADRRSTYVSLTEKGKQTCETINEQCDRFYQTLFDHIQTDKVEQILESLHILSVAFNATRKATDPLLTSCKTE